MGGGRFSLRYSRGGERARGDVEMAITRSTIIGPTNGFVVRLREIPAMDSIDDYIASFPKDVRPVLERVRRAILKAVPRAEQRISYRIPAFRLDGRYLVYFACFKHHVGLYPVRTDSPEFGRALKRYASGKATLKFPLDEAVPFHLITKVVQANALGARGKLPKTFRARLQKKSRAGRLDLRRDRLECGVLRHARSRQSDGYRRRPAVPQCVDGARRRHAQASDRRVLAPADRQGGGRPRHRTNHGAGRDALMR